jgi:hypothetical protein
MVYGPLTWKLCCSSHGSRPEPPARSASTVHVPAAMKVTPPSAAIEHTEFALESM